MLTKLIYERRPEDDLRMGNDAQKKRERQRQRGDAAGAGDHVRLCVDVCAGGGVVSCVASMGGAVCRFVHL